MHNAKGTAVKIQARLGGQIRQACFRTLVPESFLAGLVSVENAQLDPHAVRFEKHIFENLKKLRNPLVFWRRSWNGITPADLKGASDEALINLATSFGYTQIMGWWAIPLKCSVGEIRDPQKHLAIAVRLLQLTAAVDLKRHAYGNVLRIWNTGRADGRTHDPRYVDNALAVKLAYSEVLSAHVRTSVSPRPTNDAPTLKPAPGSPANSS